MRSKQRKTFKPYEDNTSTPLSPNPQTNACLSRQRQEHSKSKNKLKLLNNNQQSQAYQSQQLQLLTKENNELKKEIIQLKVHQFYQFDGTKLKELIAEVQNLKKELKKTKAEVTELQLQNDFLTRTNAQLKLQLEKQMQLRKKESMNVEDYRMNLKMSYCKANDHTRNTDTSRNTEDEHYSVYHSNNFQIQNTTLQDAFQCRDLPKSKQKMAVSRQQDYQAKSSRRSLLNKILSPRKTKEVGFQAGNEYLLLRRQKQKNPILQQKC